MLCLSFSKSEAELRKIWSNPVTRKIFLEKIADAGYGKDILESLQKMIDAENSDLLMFSRMCPCHSADLERKRVSNAKEQILRGVDAKQKEFLEFVLAKYIDNGVEELDEEKLPWLLNLKYKAIADAVNYLGDVDSIRSTFLASEEFVCESEGWFDGVELLEPRHARTKAKSNLYSRALQALGGEF